MNTTSKIFQTHELDSLASLTSTSARIHEAAQTRLMSSEPLMTLQLLRLHHLMTPIMPRVLVTLMLRQRSILLRLPLLVILNRFQNIVFLDGDTFDFLDFGALTEDDEAGEDGDETAEGDPDAGTPGWAIDAAPVPHPDAEKDLENSVEHVEPDNCIESPGWSGRCTETGQGRFGHGGSWQCDGRVGF
jgi:hypothetical protein